MNDKYKNSYISKEEFDALSMLNIPYEGFIIGVGYAYLTYDALEPMPLNRVRSYIPPHTSFFIPFSIQYIDTSPEAFTMSLGCSFMDLAQPMEKELGDDKGYLIIVSQSGKIIRKIKKEGDNIYIKVNEPAFYSILAKFSDESDYYALLTLSALRNAERKTGLQSLIAEPNNYGIQITGKMRDGNNLLGDITLAFVMNFDDGTSIVLDTYKGVAGGFGNGAPENGEYITSNYANRGPKSGWYNRGMTRDDVGFSFNLDPQFKTNRSLLRIHPDGNNEGTLGCIGLSGNKEILIQFRDKLRKYLNIQNKIPTKIYIIDNPNNANWSKKKTPSVNE